MALSGSVGALSGLEEANPYIFENGKFGEAEKLRLSFLGGLRVVLGLMIYSSVVNLAAGYGASEGGVEVYR